LIVKHIGGYGPQTDAVTASKSQDPRVRQLMEEFENQWGYAPSEILSIDFRTHWMSNVLTAVKPWVSQAR
jgi:hypothetical protein